MCNSNSLKLQIIFYFIIYSLIFLTKFNLFFQVANFIQSLPTGSDYSEIFRKHMIDGEALLLISQNDIVDVLNIKLGPAIKLYNSIVLLRKKTLNIFKDE